MLDAFAFSPDSQLLAGIATGQDHIVHVWPLQPAAATAAAPAPAGPVPAVSRPTGPGPAGFDACTLVTKAEAEAMLGAPVVATDNRPTACRYHAADGSGVTDIPGLGDKAYSSGDDPYCCALYVLKGSRLFEIVVTPFGRSFDQGAPTARLLTLARAAASHV